MSSRKCTTDGCVVKAQQPRNLALLVTISMHLMDFIETSAPMFLTTITAFVISVVHVLTMSGRKQVRRVATRRVIAFVTNAVTFWYLSVHEAIGYSTSSLKFGDSSVKSDTEQAIAARVFGCNPRPTFGVCAALNLSPKTS